VAKAVARRDVAAFREKAVRCFREFPLRRFVLVKNALGVIAPPGEERRPAGERDAAVCRKTQVFQTRRGPASRV
jgi:hypothetical protein